jgi:hypothetical protein
MNLAKHISAKKAWGELSNRARLGERRGFAACVWLLYKNQFISKEQAIAQLEQWDISPLEFNDVIDGGGTLFESRGP